MSIYEDFGDLDSRFDKFMNILIYTCFNDRYRDFDKSKSKNRSFKKILTGNNTIYTSTGIFMELPDDFIEWSHDYLDKINRQYRTAEVHGDGSARKWVFQEPDINKTPLALVNELINHMDQFLRITCFILMGKDFGEELSKGIYEEKY